MFALLFFFVCTFRIKKSYGEFVNRLQHSQRKTTSVISVLSADSCYQSDEQINTSLSEIEPSIPSATNAMISGLSDASVTVFASRSHQQNGLNNQLNSPQKPIDISPISSSGTIETNETNPGNYSIRR